MKIIAPVKGRYKVTSPFGWRIHPITGKRRLHTGADIVTNKANEPIIAPEDGVVLEARKSNAPGGGYGYYVKYRGKSGAVHLMAHLKAASTQVQKGDKVTQGQKLGVMGSTGASTADHLHWEVRGKVRPVDPIAWMDRQNAEAK
jgi:murein DD-endopeptidase MepM/ murein hydrolase activator NlpD